VSGALRYDLIVFDWDGTLADSTGLIAECVQQAAMELRFRVPTMQEAKQVIGLGLLPALNQLFPGLADRDYQAFAVAFRARYLPRDHEATLYPGVVEMLQGLAQPERCLAVATGKPRRGLERAFDRTGIRGHFHFSRCGDEGFGKPHPDMLLKLMDASGATAKRTLMIGDTTFDLQMAQSAGVDAIAVTYGAHRRRELTQFGPMVMADRVGQLTQWLSRNA